MASPANVGLVLQGGGALGAYELGAARRLYKDDEFQPDVIAGVSIGAITAALLARPAAGFTPLGALEEFWRRVKISEPWPLYSKYASFFGVPGFFIPRRDILSFADWTYFYETTPLRETLKQLLDVDTLKMAEAKPQLLVSAFDIEGGEIKYFNSADRAHGGLTVDHIMASASLPPGFPATIIEGSHYWDGGLFDNTPLGAVIDSLTGDNRVIYVVNLFPIKTSLPKNIVEVNDHLMNLQFSNKSAQDVSLMNRFNKVVALIEALDALPKEGNPTFENRRFLDAFAAVKAQKYVSVPGIITIDQRRIIPGGDSADFSKEAIEKRAAKGFRATDEALADHPGSS